LRSPLAAGLVLFSAVWVGGLHCAAALNDGGGVPEKSSDDTHWLDAGEPDSLSATRARRVDTPEGERIAIVRSGDSVSAIHGVCAHQGGPLYEGKVIDGCLTCPWHGWQYRPEDGQSPPPFTEKIPTYRMKLEGGRLWVDPTPLPAGTAVTPVRIGAADD
ncbi:MAG: Rieske (2Fe-2S) protein, partial [Myxococcota bacterium]